MKRVEIPTELYELVRAMAEEAELPDHDLLLLALFNGLSYTAAVERFSPLLRARLEGYSRRVETKGERQWHRLGGRWPQ